MSDITPPPAPDPGNGDPAQWSEPFTEAELDALLERVDNPTDPLVVAGLAGTLYDPEGGADDGEAA